MTILLSAVTGMLLHAALTVGWHWLFFREAMTEGPYYYVVAVVSLVFGALLGSASCTARRCGGGRPLLAAVNCLLAGLAVLGAFVGYAYVMASNPANPHGFWRVLALACLFFLPTVIWAAVSLRQGLRLLWQAAS